MCEEWVAASVQKWDPVVPNHVVLARALLLPTRMVHLFPEDGVHLNNRKAKQRPRRNSCPQYVAPCCKQFFIAMQKMWRLFLEAQEVAKQTRIAEAVSSIRWPERRHVLEI